MDDALLAVLRTHNPWLDRPRDQGALMATRQPDPFLARKRRLELQPGSAELVTGPRQAGKSTWILESLSREPLPLLILHAEEPRIRELGRSPARALQDLADVLQPETVLLLEEVQNLPDAPLFIKGLVDLEKDRRIVATGSSSFSFQARTRESLAGRVRRTLLLPFSLQEAQGLIPSDLSPAIRAARSRELWERILVSGAYPDAFLKPDPATTLYHLVEAFVLRDVSDLHTIERPHVFRKLLELAAADVGNLINLSEWAGLAQASRNTAARYLEIAEQAHLLRLVPPFVGGKRAEVTGTPKLYFLDNGLRNAVFAGFGPLQNRADRGALWENAVYGELMKRLPLLDEVRFWRSKNGAEVDFVIRRQDRLIGLEVKAGDLQRPTFSRAARSFSSAYRPRCLAVINAPLRHDLSADGVPVLFRRPWELDEVLEFLEE